MSSFASTSFVEGTYENGVKGCELIVSIGDYFRTNVNRLIVEMDISDITPYGAILTQTMESSLKQLNDKSVVVLDNAAGIGSYVVALVKFNKDGTVESFEARKASPRGDWISKIINCENMKLND